MNASKYPLLKKVAEIVFAVPTSSATSDRAWSILDHIHTKKRNRLLTQNVEMLAYIYINYGTMKRDRIDLALYQSCPESLAPDDPAETVLRSD
jgi:hAT family C-terminal dimerisation region